MADIIGVDMRGGIAVVTVDAPPVNALGAAVRKPLAEVLERLRPDASVKAIVFTCGGRTFFAGADISEFGKPPVAPTLTDLFERIEACGKPTIAAIHGQALGGGLELALLCNHRVAVPSAKFGLPEVKLGILPGLGGTQRLPRIVGLGPALDLLLSGDRIDAAEAFRIGLVSRMSASGDSLIDEAQALAERIAARPTAASAYVKEAARDGFEMDLRAGLKLEKDLFVLLMSTEDRREAAAAFREKRPPAFTGR